MRCQAAKTSELTLMGTGMWFASGFLHASSHSINETRCVWKPAGRRYGAVGKVRVTLLGAPRVERNDTATPQPKGKKAWGLLAYLLLAEGPHTRSHLAELLFVNAEDPLGALRWNLSQLRRLLGVSESLRGSHLDLERAPGTVVDLDVLTRGAWTEAVRLRGLGCDLLEGMSFASAPTFETWLTLERARIRKASHSVLREAAAACLGSGRLDSAADFAARAIALDPFDEASHEMLIRAYAAAGLDDKANDALGRCTWTFREELGLEPGAAVRNAVSRDQAAPAVAVRGAAAARAQLDLGRSAIKAGAIQTGIDSLRTAVDAAEDSGDEPLLAASLLALAYALIHSVRGRDGEASSLLHRALGLADANDISALAAECLRELGYIEMLVGSYDRALSLLQRSLAAQAEGASADAWTLAYEAVCYSDTGRYNEALDRLDRCLSLDENLEATPQKAYALCLVGRIQMLRGELADARASLEASVSTAATLGWTGLLPWPEALLAEVDLLAGVPAEEARERLEHALSLAQHIGDPCWEGAALHGLSLVEAASGATDAASARLELAAVVCVRFPDSYIWMRAYILDALCDLASRIGSPTADRWISDLQNLAAQTGMNEFLARSYVYRARCGDADAGSTARLIAREVDNPSLLSLL